MKDVAKQPIGVGTLVMDIGEPLLPTHKDYIPSLGVFKIPGIRTRQFNGDCKNCGSLELITTGKVAICGCQVLKISPDENQFDDETNKELDKDKELAYITPTN